MVGLSYHGCAIEKIAIICFMSDVAKSKDETTTE